MNRRRPRKISEKQLAEIQARTRDNWNKALPKLIQGAPEVPRPQRRRRRRSR